jgi:SAM-dependent methyltransferase
VTAHQPAVAPARPRRAPAGQRFVAADALDRARRAGGPAVELLRTSVEARAFAAAATLLEVPTSGNLFLVQNRLLELALQVALDGDEPCRERLGELLVGLGGIGASETTWPSEVHAGFVAVGIAVALDLAGERLDEDARRTGRATLAALAERLHATSQDAPWSDRVVKRMAWNHAIVAFAGLGVAGVMLDEHPLADEWMATATERALLFFEHGITPAGMGREGLAYNGFVFRNLGPFLLAARAGGSFDYVDPAANPFVDRLARVPDWYAAELFPGGRWLQNLNDSYWDPRRAIGGFLPVFGPLAPERTAAVWDRTVGAHGRGDYGHDPRLRISSLFESVLWAPSEAPAAPVAPEAFHCPVVGYVTERTEDRQTVFGFNAGPYIGAIHDQSDNNSFTYVADGVPLVLDSGASNIAEEGNASSSLGHSAVIIDGLGQRPSGGGHGVAGEIVRLDRRPTHTIVGGDATGAYGTQAYNTVTRAVRWCVFVRHDMPYVLVYDDVDKDGAEHAYEFVFHTPEPVQARVADGAVELSIEFEQRHLRACIAVAGGADTTISSEPCTLVGQPPFEEHRLWRVARRAVNPRFVAVVGAFDRRPAVTVAASGHGLEVEVDLGAGRPADRFWLPDGGRRGKGVPTVTLGGDAEPEPSTPQPPAVAASPRRFTRPRLRRGDDRHRRAMSPQDTPTPTAPAQSGVAAYEASLLARTAKLRGLADALDRIAADEDYPMPDSEKGIVMGTSTFRLLGMDFLWQFAGEGGLEPQHAVLDIGCGGGRMAAPLLYYLDGGSYHGFDVHKPSIDWCKQAIAPRDSAFTFEYVDVDNSLYHPAKRSAETYEFPYGASTYDFAIATSVFTHMFRGEVENYLRQTFRVLRPGATFFCTAFLLSESALATMHRGRAVVTFAHEHQGSLIEQPDRPAAAVGHFPAVFFSLVTGAGFVCERWLAGSWPGGGTGVSHQDILVLRKPATAVG